MVSRSITIGTQSYILKRWVTRGKYDELKKHPQFSAFQFKACGTGFNLYVKNNTRARYQ